ncbi:MAG: metallophosphoesterase [Candidatus Lokiarchaeota archaeon]|nr:metallophosphoesterase [Candidatus Lokiarchaeota archaeon]
MIKTEKEEILIGLLSDTHIPARTHSMPDRVLEDFKNRKVDYVFHLGDFTSFEVYERLIEAFGRDKVVAVKGNMDFDSKIKNSLPDTLEFKIYEHHVLMLHGMGGPNMIIRRLIKNLDLLNSNYDLIIFGHTHKPVNEKHNGILFFNPGTTTPIDNKLTVISSYGYLRISKNKIEPEIIYL